MKIKGSFKIKGKNDSETDFEFDLVEEGAYSPSEIYEIAQQAVIDLIEINYKINTEDTFNNVMEELKKLMNEGHTQGCALEQITYDKKCFCKP